MFQHENGPRSQGSGERDRWGAVQSPDYANMLANSLDCSTIPQSLLPKPQDMQTNNIVSVLAINQKG